MRHTDIEDAVKIAHGFVCMDEFINVERIIKKVEKKPLIFKISEINYHFNKAFRDYADLQIPLESPSVKLRKLAQELDPTFGKTTSTGTEAACFSDRVHAQGEGLDDGFDITQNCTVTQISFYVKSTVPAAPNNKMLLGIYDDSGAGGRPGNLDGQVAEVTTVANSWCSGDGSISLIPDAYYLAWNVKDSTSGVYDTPATNALRTSATGQGYALTSPFPSVGSGVAARLFGCYATYTPVALPGVSPVRRLKSRGEHARSKLIFSPSLKL